jgi:endogenous inhibitor of DNA gyrase (YacG/DUF329 family)
MHQIKEQLAYLRGLTEGLNVGENSSEGRVLVGIMHVMDEMVRSMDRLHMANSQLEEYVEAIDDDLTDLEDEFYDEYADEFEFEYDEDLEDLDYDDDAIEYMEMSCPNCHETVFVDEDVFDDDEVVEVLCPECQETVLISEESPLYASDEVTVD